MDSLSLAHLIFVSMWGGLLIAESVVETIGMKEMLLAARLHFWMDVVGEIPLVTGVIVTGALLTLRIWPPTGMHLVKIGLAVVAVSLNLYCGVFVMLRYRHRHDPARLLRYRTHVRASALGFPFGIAAAYVGLSYFA